MRIANEQKGIFLSDLIRFLQAKHPDSTISILVSACRVFHEDLTPEIAKRQLKTSRVTVDEFIKKYL